MVKNSDKRNQDSREEQQQAMHQMNMDQFRERLIEDGLASIQKHERRPERIEGGRRGFEMCRSLRTPVEFEAALAVQAAAEHKLLEAYRVEPSEESLAAYKAERMVTAQIEFVYDRLKVGWGHPVLSAQAIVHYGRVVGEAKDASEEESEDK